MVKQKQLELSNLVPVRNIVLTAGDTTPEKLAILLAENNERLFIVSDEGGMLKSVTGKRYSGEPNIDLLLQGYSGSASSQYRVSGNRSIELYNPAISMLIMGQYTILDGFMGNSEFADRGLLARFMFCAPPPLPSASFNPNPPPVPPRVEGAYLSLMVELLSISVPSQPFRIGLDQDANRVFAQFHENLKKNRLETELAYMQDWGGRYHGTVLRIAGNLHLMQHGLLSANHLISGTTMRNAIALGEYFLAYAKWAYMGTGTDTDIARARDVLNSLRAKRPVKISQRDLHHDYCPKRNTVKIKDFEPAIDLLVEHGYLRAIGHTKNGAGRPMSLR